MNQWTVQGTPILVYLPFLVNQHAIFIDIQTILPNVVNIELFIFHVKNPNPHSVISVSNRSRNCLRMSDENGGHRPASTTFRSSV